MAKLFMMLFLSVATVLTVYGIETYVENAAFLRNKLQQYLPFTVLKPLDTKSIKPSKSGCNSTYRLRY